MTTPNRSPVRQPSTPSVARRDELAMSRSIGARWSASAYVGKCAGQRNGVGGPARAARSDSDVDVSGRVWAAEVTERPLHQERLADPRPGCSCASTRTNAPKRAIATLRSSSPSSNGRSNCNGPVHVHEPHAQRPYLHHVHGQLCGVTCEERRGSRN